MCFYMVLQLRLQGFKIFLQVVCADRLFLRFTQCQRGFTQLAVKFRVLRFNLSSELNDFLHELA